MREGGAALSSNNEAVVGGQHNRFETSIEDFYATLDQIELNLKCAAETTGQSQTSGRWEIISLSRLGHHRDLIVGS